MQLKITSVPPSYVFMKSDYFAGIELFWAGLLVGATNLACGISVGVAGASTALADAGNGDIFIRILIIEVIRILPTPLTPLDLRLCPGSLWSGRGHAHDQLCARVWPRVRTRVKP